MNEQIPQTRDQEISNLETTITALEAQRHTLGDLVVDTALELLRERLATLMQPDQAPDERKRVTVLFADVSGYTALSENLDPEDVAAIMNRLFEAVTIEIHKYGGTVDKYSGDAVMALFGAPLALENHEEMAVRAALGMQQVIAAFSADLQRERGFSVQMRIGLNSGEVLAGLVGGLRARSYTVMGDTVNLASRLEHACPVGRVLISAETARPLPAIFDFEPPQQITVKGKSDPITTYLVVGEKAERGRVRGLAGLFAPMVGREAELVALQASFAQALAQRMWRATAVTGSAGIGKSRLQREFVAWVMHTHPDTRILNGRSYAHTRTSPYAVIADLMRGLFHLGTNADLATAISQLEQGLQKLAPQADSSERRYQLGSLAGILGFNLADDPLQGLDPEQRRDRTFLSLERIFYAASAQSPLLVLIDDLHWADALSLAFLERLLHMMERDLFTQRPALFLILSRPAEEERVAYGRILTQLATPPFQTLPLHRLDENQSHDLIAALLDETLSADLRRLISDHAQGNPFYVEEVLRTLIEDGTLRENPRGGWQVTRAIADVTIPPSVRGILAARLDRLPQNDKRVTQYAAIIGRIFWQKLLSEVVGAASVEPTLLLLELRQLAERLGQSQIAEDWEWVFHHVLIQEVAYASVPKATRRAIHQQVAQVLEAELTEHTSFLLPLIAYHYEAGHVPDKAIDYLARAGERAAEQFANEDAVDYFSRALALLDKQAADVPMTAEQLAMRYRLLNGRVGVYHLSGQRQEQAQNLAHLKDLAAELNQHSYHAEVSRLYTNYYDAISDFPAAIQSAQELVKWADVIKDDRRKVEGLTRWAFGLLRQGNMDESKELLQQARQLAQKNKDLIGEADSLNFLGIAHFFLGENQAARDSLESALKLARDLKDLQRQATCLTNLIGIYHGFGNLYLAQQSGEDALAITRMIGDRSKEATILNNLGAILHALGNLADARMLHQSALILAQTLNDLRNESLSANNLSLVLHDLGDDTLGQYYAEHALAIDRQIGDRRGEGYSLTALALTLEGQQKWAEALDAHTAALDLRKSIGQDACGIDNVAGLARVALFTGALDTAVSHTTTALDWIHDKGIDGIEYPIRVYLTCADVLQANAAAVQAQSCIEKAAALLEAQASRISQDEARQTFLNQVPLHRELQTRLSTNTKP